MKRVMRRVVSSVALAVAASLALTSASAQVDPLAPLPDSRPAESAPRQVPASSYTPVNPSHSPNGATFVGGGFEGYKQRLAALSRSAGVREATIQSVIPYLTLNSRVIELDRGQPGQVGNPNATPPFAPYRRAHVTSDLISRGRGRYAVLWPYLRQIEARYGVEPQVLMAIYGHETSFGRVTGGFDLLQSLSTLAYDGRRRSFFEGEFVAAMRLLDEGVSRERLKGSWAGATGYPQFMPTVVQRLRVDGDGDGFANIWTNEADALASIANYFRDAGWKPNVHWGVATRVPPGFNRGAVVSHLKSPRCERVYARHSRWMTMREWRALGVVPVGRTLPDSEMASLIEPDGPNATAYLLSENYRVILDYNCSNFYALSVGLLADAIARG